jgi:hypothetical protein
MDVGTVSGACAQVIGALAPRAERRPEPLQPFDRSESPFHAVNKGTMRAMVQRQDWI